MKLREESIKFFNLLDGLPDKEYLFSIISYKAAPTIREKKPSSLVTFTNNRREVYNIWKTFKLEVMNQLELDFIELKDKNDSVRVLFYKRELLEKCINKRKCREFLNTIGYEHSITLEQCLNKLKNKFEYICPHEIGVFLGIPVEDVVGFIKHKGENSVLCRYWKVYHNPDMAIELFRSFDRAKECIKEEIKNRHINNEVSFCVLDSLNLNTA